MADRPLNHDYHQFCQCQGCHDIREARKPGGISYNTEPVIVLPKIASPRAVGPVAMPTGYAERKALPIVTGCLDYFPDALLAVAECSMISNEQHNPGEPLHWAREKSTDEVNTLGRHLLQRGTRDTDGVRHSAKVAWRALAMLQKEIEAEAALSAAGTSTRPGDGGKD